MVKYTDNPEDEGPDNAEGINIASVNLFLNTPPKPNLVEEWERESRTIMSNVSRAHRTMIKLSGMYLDPTLDVIRLGVEKHRKQISRIYPKYQMAWGASMEPGLTKAQRDEYKAQWQQYSGEIGERIHLMTNAWNAYRLAVIKNMKDQH